MRIDACCGSRPSRRAISGSIGAQRGETLSRAPVTARSGGVVEGDRICMRGLWHTLQALDTPPKTLKRPWHSAGALRTRDATTGEDLLQWNWLTE
jgi:hypothetical protein